MSLGRHEAKGGGRGGWVTNLLEILRKRTKNPPSKNFIQKNFWLHPCHLEFEVLFDKDRPYLFRIILRSAKKFWISFYFYKNLNIYPPIEPPNDPPIEPPWPPAEYPWPCSSGLIKWAEATIFLPAFVTASPPDWMSWKYLRNLINNF